MAVTGHKPSGHFTTFDPSGRKVEGETRQCVHCERTWVYMPHDARIVGVVYKPELEVRKQRGFCLLCHGITCCEAGCSPCPVRVLRGEAGIGF